MRRDSRYQPRVSPFAFQTSRFLSPSHRRPRCSGFSHVLSCPLLLNLLTSPQCAEVVCTRAPLPNLSPCVKMRGCTRLQIVPVCLVATVLPGANRKTCWNTAVLWLRPVGCPEPNF